MNFFYKNIYILLLTLVFLSWNDIIYANSKNLNINIPSETQTYLKTNGIDNQKLQFLIRNFIQQDYENSNVTITPYMIKNFMNKSYSYIANKSKYIFKTAYFTESDIALNNLKNDYWNGFDIPDVNLINNTQINDVDSCLTNINTNVTINIFANIPPALQPIAMIDNKLINAFGETVGSLNNLSTDKKQHFLFLNGKNTNLVWKDKKGCGEPKYWSFTSPWKDQKSVNKTMPYFCYTCKLIEFSFQIISIMSNTIFKEWASYILILMALLAGLYILQEYYKNIENITNEGNAKKLFIQLGKRILIVVAAIAFLFNINGTIIAYVYKPITWASIAMSDSFISQDRQQSKCGYIVQKEIFDKTRKESGLKKILPGLSYANQNILKQSDTTIDLSQDIICSFFRIEEQIRTYIALSFATLGYSGYGLIKGFISIITIICFIFINLLWTLYYVEVVLMLGLATIAIPFALLGWAIPFPYIKDWRLKILNIFKNGAVKLVMMSMLTMIIGSFISYVMFGINAYELEKLISSDQYNRIILINLSAFYGFDILKTIISLIVISYILTKIKSWEKDLNSLIGGSDSPTNGLAKELSTLLKEIKNKALKGVSTNIIKKIIK